MSLRCHIGPISPGAVIEALQRFIQATDHQFWPDRVSMLDASTI